MKAKYKEKSRLILTDNKLSKEEQIKAIGDLFGEMADEFAGVNAKLLQNAHEHQIESV